MDTKAISDCFQMSLAGQNTFREVLKLLSATGVQRFHIDLIRLERICYSKDDEVYVERFFFDLPIEKRPKEFNENGIVDAIRQIQERQIEFVEFLRRLIASGVAGYWVFIEGDRIIYYGRNGEQYLRPLAATAAGQREIFQRDYQPQT